MPKDETENEPFTWKPLLHGSASQKAEALMDALVDEHGGLRRGSPGVMVELAAAQVWATLALEDAIREAHEQ
jgi:hypothetical protein